MSARLVSDSRQSELWRQLSAVMDPELDESIVSMGFVERAEVKADGSVEVEFRLPTYWCSPNFAFLMLDDMRLGLESLSWHPEFRISLMDHILGEEINAGLAAGKCFGDIVDRLAPDADIAGLRATFSMKAFMRRQEALLLGLRRIGLADEVIVGFSKEILAKLPGSYPELADAARRYREALDGRFSATGAMSPAFLTWKGRALSADELPPYLAELRAVRINMEFNGALCRGLKQSRYREAVLEKDGPSLVDFITGAVPAGRRAATERER